MSRRLFLLLLAGFCTLTASLGVSLAVLGTERDTAACPESPLVGEADLRIDAPSRITAGERLTVAVSLAGDEAALPVTVALLRADGPLARSMTLRNGHGAAMFGPRATVAAGSLRLVAASCGLETSRPIEIAAGPVEAPLDVLVGPRRIRADGTSHATAVTIPTDGYGNAVDRGTAVSYALRRPGGEREAAAVPTDRLLSVLRVDAGTTAGPTAIAARIGEARGAAADLIETAGRPRPGFPISVEHGPSLGGSVDQPVVVLEGVRDRFGNPLADGALVTLAVKGAGIDGAQLQATLIGSSARIPLQPSEATGTLSLQAFIDGVASQRVTYDVRPGVGDGPIPLRAIADSGLAVLDVAIGPVLGDLDAYAPDGTVATLQVTAPSGTISLERMPLVDGMASWQLRAVEPGTYRVRAETIFGSATVTEVVS